MTFKHIEIAKAWLEGKTVQVQYKESNSWNDVLPASTVSQMPFFSNEWNFRIKPSVFKYKRFLYNRKDNYGKNELCVGCMSDRQNGPFAAAVQWIDTEWQEVEVSI